uniref:SNARE-complex protein Syntaxin-18 N-terminal domain-containing protein n=1 Tax=Amblyomma maculatum TaxID=34609 RepID=G3MRA7_AMBMU
MERTKLFAEICGLLLLERGEDGRSESMQICRPAKRPSQAYAILRSITAMKKFLCSRRGEYVRAAAPVLLPDSRCITVDLERRRTDELVETFVRNARAAIDALSQQRSDNLRSLQACEHRRNVRMLLRDYLSETCQIYAEMKAVYIKRVCDRHRWSRLGSPYRRLGPGCAGSSSGFVSAPLMNGLRQFHRFSNAASKMVSVGSWFQSTDDSEGQRESTNFDLSLSYDECVLFEEESKVLMDRLNSPQEAVRHIETQLIDIYYLQRVLTGHILEQEDDVERMATATRLASAHLAAATRVLEDNVVHRTSFGYWPAGLIFWLSLVLLFLHWLTP